MRNDDSDKASFTHSTMPGELRRVEVITGTARRRTWSAHEKAPYRRRECSSRGQTCRKSRVAMASIAGSCSLGGGKR